MDFSLSEALEFLGNYSWVLLCIVAVHAAVQVRKYQDTYPTAGLQHVARGLLATVWFGVGSALAQALLLAEPYESMLLPVGACVVAYLAVTYSPGDYVYKVSQTPLVNALLICGLEVCRALCVGVGVSSGLKSYPGNNMVPALLGALRGTWGWLVGRPGAKVVLGRSITDVSWPAPPVSAPASLVASALLVLANNRSDAERIVAGLIGVLVAYRGYELYSQ
ncbi:Trimeric intracellular cation channel type 1B.1 [Frankliniella fusca]|uniref:Trimeric intracellular cation channel type 1B.1 n=1 Tax=Frankliniella fusca TaxID=407009 RepID=A0AAE1H799_9NEOP|nr:Trimeric intracellular cation channel type 1B.1 [Frankliniella fusca]